MSRLLLYWVSLFRATELHGHLRYLYTSGAYKSCEITFEAYHSYEKLCVTKGMSRAGGDWNTRFDIYTRFDL